MKILVIKIGALGDVVRTTVLLEALHCQYPTCHISWLTSDRAAPLLEGLPTIQRVLRYPQHAPQVEQSTFDWVLSLEDDPALCMYASTIKCGKLSGAYMNREGCPAYTQDFDPWFGMGLMRPAERGGLQTANELKKVNNLTHAQILYRCLGIYGPVRRPRLHLDWSHRAEAERLVNALLPARNRVLCALATSAGRRWEQKRWGEEPTARLAYLLHDKASLDVLLIGGPEEEARISRIAASIARPRIAVAPTTLPLKLFAAVLEQCDFLVCSDSFPLHLANALAIPFLAFFGPTSGAEIEVYDTGERLETSLPCGRCYLPTCTVRPSCMQILTPEEVFRRVLQHPRLPATRPVRAVAQAPLLK